MKKLHIQNIIKRQQETNELDHKRLGQLYKALVLPKQVDSSELFLKFTDTSVDKNNQAPNEETIPKPNASIINKRGINRLVNVYQLKYKNDEHVTGFGDFIRGCFYMMYVCEVCNLKYNIVVNHPVSRFLKNNDGVIFPDQLLNTIRMCKKNNCEDPKPDQFRRIQPIFKKQINDDFVSYLCNDVPIIQNAAFIYNIIYPYHKISQEHKLIMQKTLLPTEEMESIVSENMLILGIKEKEYCVLHIRNDDYATNNLGSSISKNYMARLCGDINEIVKYNEHILVISNNLHLKRILHLLYPSFKMTFNEPTHLNENIKENLIVNTMLDFYLMSRSYLICCLTTYVHGSGFSQWCAETYNIKYDCKYCNNL
jgi:hypothetical protein